MGRSRTSGSVARFGNIWKHDGQVYHQFAKLGQRFELRALDPPPGALLLSRQSRIPPRRAISWAESPRPGSRSSEFDFRPVDEGGIRCSRRSHRAIPASALEWYQCRSFRRRHAKYTKSYRGAAKKDPEQLGHLERLPRVSWQANSRGVAGSSPRIRTSAGCSAPSIRSAGASLAEGRDAGDRSAFARWRAASSNPCSRIGRKGD